MLVLKNHTLVFLIALLMQPALYFLCTLSSGLHVVLFVMAMLLIAWAANQEISKERCNEHCEHAK